MLAASIVSLMSGVLDGLRIGELERRLGVTSHTLRAWERRYGLFDPVRSAGGYRLYSPSDERRALAVIALRDKGISASEACRRVLAEERVEGAGNDNIAPMPIAEILQALDQAVADLDEVSAHALVDRLLRDHDFEVAVRDGLMPFLTRVGTAGGRGRLLMAGDHFAAPLVRRRRPVLSLDWANGTGTLPLLACPPGERHGIPLLVLGLRLAGAGWRVRFLGQDTPLTALAAACRQLHPDVVVLSATRPSTLRAHQSTLRHLATAYPLALGGRGASQAAGRLIGAQVLDGDVLDGARTLTQWVQR